MCGRQVLLESATGCQYKSTASKPMSIPYPVDALLARLLVYIIAKHLRLRTNSYTVANLLDPHFLQHLLVHVH